MTGPRYWMLMASLPHLPRVEAARQMPIGQERLEARWHLLPAAERARWDALAAVLVHSPMAGEHPGADERLLARWQAFRQRETEPCVRELAQDLLRQRALVAALRARRASASGPPATWTAVLDPWGGTVRRRWQEPDFGLQVRLPWLSQAREFLEAQDATGLQRLLIGLAWHRCEGLRAQHPASAAALFAWRLQWTQLHAWLSCDAERARAWLLSRSEALVSGYSRWEEPAA